MAQPPTVTPFITEDNDGGSSLSFKVRNLHLTVLNIGFKPKGPRHDRQGVSKPKSAVIRLNQSLFKF